MNRLSSLLSLATVLIIALLSACSSQTVKTANYTPIKQETADIAEELLLDVGIQIFDGGLDEAADDEDTLIFPELRNAETHYMPYLLMETLQNSAAWGAVRVVPNEENAVDVLVQGKIVQSDGEELVLAITVTDATGKVWIDKKYKELASKYAYDRHQYPKVDPFQGLYNRVANDMLEYKRALKDNQIATVRTVAELRFAQNFSPDAFSSHVEEDKKGRYRLVHLPAKNDPMLNRIRRIRERDYLFVDTLQEYYGEFVRQMDTPYSEWRSQSYDEVIEMRKLQRSARNRTIAGIAAIVGGIAAAGSDNGSTATAGQVAVAGGGYMVKSGFDKRAQAKIHVEALQELGDSLETEIEPQIIQLEDRTITLSGTVENQYNQWRDILQDIYRTETGNSDTQGTVN